MIQQRLVCDVCAAATIIEGTRWPELWAKVSVSYAQGTALGEFQMYHHKIVHLCPKHANEATQLLGPFSELRDDQK